MENDALAQELAHSQEVCREMLAARRAARDALADVSAHNCRLLAAYVEKKREAEAAAEALAAHQRESQVGEMLELHSQTETPGEERPAGQAVQGRQQCCTLFQSRAFRHRSRCSVISCRRASAA